MPNQPSRKRGMGRKKRKMRSKSSLNAQKVIECDVSKPNCNPYRMNGKEKREHDALKQKIKNRTSDFNEHTSLAEISRKHEKTQVAKRKKIYSQKVKGKEINLFWNRFENHFS